MTKYKAKKGNMVNYMLMDEGQRTTKQLTHYTLKANSANSAAYSSLPYRAKEREKQASPLEGVKRLR